MFALQEVSMRGRDLFLYLTFSSPSLLLSEMTFKIHYLHPSPSQSLLQTQLL